MGKKQTKKSKHKLDKLKGKKIDAIGRDRTSVEERVIADKKKFLTLLEKHLGIVSNVCKKMKMSLGNYYRWYKEDEEFKKAVNNIQDTFDIYVEDKLKNSIAKNDGHSIRFYLSHRVKKYRPNLGLGQADDLEPIKLMVTDFARGEVPEDPEDSEELDGLLVDQDYIDEKPSEPIDEEE